MIPLYILGLLSRFGPQHGYQIKKLVEKQLADFTYIKLPTIYYHLDKLEAKGYVSAQTDQEGARPEKKVYQVTDLGSTHFLDLLDNQLDLHYRPSFDSDALFYFSDHLDKQHLLTGLTRYLEKLEASLARIESHRAETLAHLPPSMKPSADIIFEHHAVHYRAEKVWAQTAITTIEKGNDHD